MPDSLEADAREPTKQSRTSVSAGTALVGPDIQKGTEMIINGKEEDIATPITVAELVEQRGLRADRVAVELNGEIVPRAQRAQTQLKGTDTLEIVTFVQGG